MRKVTVSRMRERYAQTVLTFRITYVCRENSSQLKSDKNNRYFTWRPMYIYHNISLSFFRVRNIPGKSCRENQNTYFMFNAFFFPPENRSVYGVMWKNILEPDRTQMATRWTGFGCWISKVTDTFSEYVIIISFPQQQWLHGRASMLCLYLHF